MVLSYFSNISIVSPSNHRCVLTHLFPNTFLTVCQSCLSSAAFTLSLFKLRMISVFVCHSPSSLSPSKSTCFLQPSSFAHCCSLWFLYILFSFFLVSSYRNKHTNKQNLTTKTNQPNLLFWETFFFLLFFFFFSIVLEGERDHCVFLSNTFGLLVWNQFRTAWWERKRPMQNMATICMWPWAIAVIYFSLLTSVCHFSWALLTLLAGFLEEWILLVCS